MLHFLKMRRRAALRAQPFPEPFAAIVNKNVAYAAVLDDGERRELHALTQILLAEKTFEGCGGLTLDDEIRVTIAAQACILLLHRDTDVYPGVETILVYPHAYLAEGRQHVGPVVLDSVDARLGESWTRGVVVLAWDHVRTAAHHLAAGQNVVLHEFAHQLDAEDGEMTGAPELGPSARYVAWARVLGDEYAELAGKLHDGRATDIDAYGATNPAEFFAVITEMFFEKPRSLRRRHPALYAELLAFFRQDPAAAAERLARAKPNA